MESLGIGVYSWSKTIGGSLPPRVISQSYPGAGMPPGDG
jgi:hypothetical protein